MRGRVLVAGLQPREVRRRARRLVRRGPTAPARRASSRTSPAPASCASCRCRARRRASPARRGRRRRCRTPSAAAPARSRGRRRRRAPAGRARWSRSATPPCLRDRRAQASRAPRPLRLAVRQGSFASKRRTMSSRSCGQPSASHDGATGGVLMCWRDDGRRVVAAERRLAGDQLVQHAAERVEVGARRDFAAERLLRRHVRDRADEHAVHRQPRLLEGDGEAEVADLGRAVGGEPDVARA